ncbi:hypothetical protein B5C34_15725 [Pacificimonas flava]|uniref:Dipeptidyl peptidase IV n=2 Tax=Pacificimonas TaxID=1960290 RepID=A0A219B0U5_9SPHN|nr:MULTISPECIES: DPP IV N-terminal domain-containing protein [Pacificimonas]MBZ6379585.1 DPP IV N-terminal domain-containing protein [Pacificimonas aurantium]OWV31941.1 hypothetical protein B5C34_15725 [Pacificimonas flava]
MKFCCNLMKLLIAGMAGFTAVSSVAAERPLMREAYDRAAFIANDGGNGYYLNRLIIPTWIGQENSFWYRRETGDGQRFTRFDADTGTKGDLFDHERLATLLSEQGGFEIAAGELPIRALTAYPEGSVEFLAFSSMWRFSAEGALHRSGPGAEYSSAVRSPDGRKLAFVRDGDLWVQQVDSGAEVRLAGSDDSDLTYAAKAQTQRWAEAQGEILWSPDSRRLLTIRTDEREVRKRAAIDFAPDDSPYPTLVERAQALPGDPHIPTFQLLIFNVESGEEVSVDWPPLAAVRMLDTPIGGNRSWWSADGETVYFVDIERGEKTVRLLAADAETGTAHELFSESRSEGIVELAHNVYLPVTLAMLPKRNQLIWYSERSGWPHLYLYDLSSGELVRQLTSGDWSVRDILYVDENSGEVFVSVAGREEGKNPYYQEVARIDLENGAIDILSAGDEDRQVVGPSVNELFIGEFEYGVGQDRARGFAPTGDYWVESLMRIDRPTTTVLRRRDGTRAGIVEDAEVSGLPEGFQWPEPVTLLAADGKTQIYGIVARPSDFDPAKRYPIIDHIYGGPQTVNVPTSFTGAAVDAQAMAELGFVTVVIDGRGTPGRSRAFHDFSSGAVQKASNLEDHIAGIRQLSAARTYIDGEKVGIFGFSAGGYMTTRAMFEYGEVFDVGVAGSGNYDQRLFYHSWGERYHGMPEEIDYGVQATSSHAAGLSGDLLLMHGLRDFNVHPAAFFQTVQALIDANKPFDMLVLPQGTHSMSGYALKRQWDYFVEKLAGAVPLEDYVITSAHDADAAYRKILRRRPVTGGEGTEQ